MRVTCIGVATAGLALLVAMGATGARAATLPLISGKYLYTQQMFCQMGVTITNAISSKLGGSYVQSTNGTSTSANEITLSAGTLSFVQSKTTPGTGTATINGEASGGSTVLLTQTGAGSSGTQGAPISEQASSGSANFNQTATTLTLDEGSGTNNFSIYYGAAAKGIAATLVFGGVDSKGCAETYTLTRY
jgi:hypothetical protein